MASSSQSPSASLTVLLFRGSHIPTHPVTIEEVTKDSLEELLDILDKLHTLWVEYGRSSFGNALKAQDDLGTNFEIGLGWMIQRAIFRSDFTGTSEEFKEHLDADKIIHSAVAEICASESMCTICHKFMDAISNLNESVEGTQILDLSLFEFAGTINSRANLGLDFVNKAISWVESHGENALEDPRLSTIENVRVKFWDIFKLEDNNQDACVGNEHRLGLNLWNCPTCVVHVTLQKLGVPGPSSGRLSKHPTESDEPAMADANDDEEEFGVEDSDEEDAFSSAVIPAMIAHSTNSQSTLSITTLAPAAVTAAPINTVPPPQVQPAALPAPPALAPAPMGGLFKPTYVQIKANGGNALVHVQAPMNIAAILARSANLPNAQKDSRLTLVGGVRYLCPFGPVGNKCSCYFQCRPDLAKHGRVDHGVNQFPAADWAEIGPYNVDEMRILRPGNQFVLKSTRDPAHMR